MPPVKRAGIEVEQDEHGRIIHRFRQSTLGELDVCPERGRLTMTGDMPKVETDAAGLGTAAHWGMECAMHHLANEGEPLMPTAIHALMVEEFDRISALPNFEWKKYTKQRVYTLLAAVAEAFYFEIYADLEPIGIEIPFHHLTIYEDRERVIQINGTIDLLDKNIGAADWKTAGDARKFARGFGGEGWKLDRWGIQPTVYVQALLLLGLLDPDQDEWPFTYLAFALGNPTVTEVTFQRLTVTRHRGDLDWLVDRCLSYAHLIEAEVTEWPKQDNHALCSEVWCPAWNMCKGEHYAEGWPKPSAPATDN